MKEEVGAIGIGDRTRERKAETIETKKMRRIESEVRRRRR